MGILQESWVVLGNFIWRTLLGKPSLGYHFFPAEIIIQEVTLLPTYLLSVAALKEAAKKPCDWNSRLEIAALKEAAKKPCDWNSRLEVCQKLEYSPYLEALYSSYLEALYSPYLEGLGNLDVQTQTDCEMTGFACQNLKIRSPQPTLGEKELHCETTRTDRSPFPDILLTSRFRRRRPKEDTFNPINVTHVINFETEKKEDPQLIDEAFKESAEDNDLTRLKRFRDQNIYFL
ncbi:hypothetical protein DAPPUDRAFT_334200 [Daphnia pulex]|uniref:Uncharacterized protein n=1 Tax=Daphnia pulex TaxID=6669 RepID=E9HV00_DAPPU|nr:hypothetical protein DAPPUDRAFT_334200 [Daphnia pulex]|eukprot:EFX64425.1 hypothetical protein DAPPUDRAFT_334200 [Daphnia pulex]